MSVLLTLNASLMLFSCVAQLYGNDSTTKPPLVMFIRSKTLWGSALMRAEMVTWQLQQTRAAQAHCVSDESDITALDAIDVCIFTKHYVVAHLELCRERGAVVVYDAIDVFTVDPRALREAVTKFDIILLATARHCTDLGIPLRRTGAPVTPGRALCLLWEHHHTNFYGLRRMTGGGVRELASIGMSGTVPSGALTSEFERVAQANGVTFHSYDYAREVGAIASTVSTLPKDRWGQLKQHTFTLGADLAIVWPPTGDATFTKVKYGTVARLVYWMSHGVPVIHFPFESYVEVGKTYSYPLEPCTNTTCVGEQLARLIDDQQQPTAFYHECVERGLEIAAHFTLAHTTLSLTRILQLAQHMHQ